MENQHRMITGYRDLSESEIQAMNEVKELGKQIGIMVENLQSRGADGPSGLDQRWVSIGQTHLQQGLMALIRAIARPESF